MVIGRQSCFERSSRKTCRLTRVAGAGRTEVDSWDSDSDTCQERNLVWREGGGRGWRVVRGRWG